MSEIIPRGVSRDVAPRHEPDGGRHEMSINPDGARIDSLTLGGHLILVKALRGDGGEGSTHPCTPIFGPDRHDLFGLSQHGKSRKKLWTPITQTPKLVELSHDISEGRYPQGMHVNQRFELQQDGSFRLVTTHTNNNLTEALPINYTEHFYWDSSVQGWRGTKVNGKDVTEVVEKDSPMPWNDINIIQIPGKPAVKLEQKGLPVMWGWVGGPEDESGKVIKFDEHYVGLEACEGNEDRFGKEVSMIKPGEYRTTEAIISLATDEEVAKYTAAA